MESTELIWNPNKCNVHVKRVTQSETCEGEENISTIFLKSLRSAAQKGMLRAGVSIEKVIFFLNFLRP